MFPALLNDELSLREVGFSSRYEQKLTDVVMILLIAPLKMEQTQKQADGSRHPYQWDFPQLYPSITLSHLHGLGSGRLGSTSHISLNTGLPSPHPAGSRSAHLITPEKDRAGNSLGIEQPVLTQNPGSYLSPARAATAGYSHATCFTLTTSWAQWHTPTGSTVLPTC